MNTLENLLGVLAKDRGGNTEQMWGYISRTMHRRILDWVDHGRDQATARVRK